MRWCLCVVSIYGSTRKSITLCTKEADYVATATRIRENGFMRYVWSLMFPDRDVGCTTVMDDNKGGIYLTNNPVATPDS